jgi:Cysteine-rich secretory protein family
MNTNVLFFVVLLFSSLSLFAQSEPTQQEQQLVDELNRSRSEAGLSPLKIDPHLTEAAREHSRRMAKRRKLGHVLPGEPSVADRIAATGLTFNRSGENVAYHSEFNGLHPQWMASEGHRENILEPRYNAVGIGVVQSSDGLYWATQDFAHVLQQRSADEAEDLVAKRFAQLRKTAGTPALARVSSDELHNAACTMGKSGLNPKRVLAMPGVHYAVTYRNSRPEELPSSARELADERSLKKFGVGACFVKEKSNPGGTYYVVMAFY